MTTTTLPPIDWADYVRCHICTAAAGEPCVGTKAPCRSRRTLAQREAFRSAVTAHLAATVAEVAASPTAQRIGATVAIDERERFYRLAVGRYRCALPVCLCEVEGAGLAKCKDGWHAPSLIEHLDRAFPARSTPYRPKALGRAYRAPKAAEGDPTPGQIAAIMARHGLTPDGEFL